jgi:hypothetical protein
MRSVRTSLARGLAITLLIVNSAVVVGQVDELSFAQFEPVAEPTVPFSIPSMPPLNLSTVPAGCESTRGGGEPLGLRVSELEAERRDQGQVDLSWKIENSEQDILWMLERRLDTENIFYVIDILTDDQLQSQTYTDQNPHPGTSYYRMRGRAADGATELTNVESVLNDLSAGDLTVYPNPTFSVGSLTVLLPSDARKCELRLTDSQGRIIHRQTYPSGTGRSIPLTLDMIAPGMYVLQWIEDGGAMQSTRLIVGY